MNFLKNEDNVTALIGLLAILIALWVIMYLIPSIFISLFNSLLGNMILLISIILVTAKSKWYGIIMAIVCIIIYRFSHMLALAPSTTIHKEEFTTQSLQEFLKVQQTVNPQLVFDTNRLQEQATQEELDYYLKNGMWPWSQQVQDLYLEAIQQNPFIKSYPKDSLRQARKVYNEKAIVEILASQSKEGQFLLNGILVETDKYKERDGAGSYARNSGLETLTQTSTLIKCSSEKNSQPETIKYTGNEGILNSHTFDTKPIEDLKELENLIPGFKFLSGPCNPCAPDYKCKFTLTANASGVSDIYKYIWDL